MKYKQDKIALTRKQKGITIVSLMIAIIVITIFATLTIRVVNTDGIMEHAQEIQNKQNIYEQTTDYKMEQLQNEENNSVISSQKLFSMYQQAIKDGCDGTNCEKPEQHLHIGDYVQYQTDIDTSENQDNSILLTYEETGKNGVTTVAYEKLNWRVLGSSENKLVLVADNPTVATVELNGFIGYQNGEATLHKICKKLYSNYSIGATSRSINREDIEKYFGESTFEKSSYENYGLTQNFENIYHPDTWQQGAVWSGQITSTGYAYVANDYISSNLALDLLLANHLPYYISSRSATIQANGSVNWAIDSIQNDSIQASRNNGKFKW